MFSFIHERLLSNSWWPWRKMHVVENLGTVPFLWQRKTRPFMLPTFCGEAPINQARSDRKVEIKRFFFVRSGAWTGAGEKMIWKKEKPLPGEISPQTLRIIPTQSYRARTARDQPHGTVKRSRLAAQQSSSSDIASRNWLTAVLVWSVELYSSYLCVQQNFKFPTTTTVQSGAVYSTRSPIWFLVVY